MNSFCPVVSHQLVPGRHRMNTIPHPVFQGCFFNCVIKGVLEIHVNPVKLNRQPYDTFLPFLDFGRPLWISFLSPANR